MYKIKQIKAKTHQNQQLSKRFPNISKMNSMIEN